MIKTSNFEAVKVALKQDKNGYILTLAIHPDDISEDVMRDFVGSRYQIVMVRLNDDETVMQERPKESAVAKPAKQERDKVPGIVSSAGILCRDPDFWDYLKDQGELLEKNESNAVEVLHRMVGINSRLELVNNPDKELAYDTIVREFREWLNSRPPF